ISQIFKTLSFTNYWAPYYEHNLGDFTISSIATAMYLYFNFSGVCDMMIGSAALIGIRVQENFANPFLARNLPQYWLRNHITLTQIVRDVLFTPGTLLLARYTHGRHMLAITAFMSVLAFLVVGLWHGDELGFVLFGLMHGVGVAIATLYGAWLRTAPASIRAWSASRSGACVSWAITFMYVCYSSVFFGHSQAALLEIWSKLVF
ncbi:MAG: hypothetical protein K2Q01_03250, partial [Rickettsiales bacterium]|nr:hypothetical protein [Rickettsiales bacterium]